jgi:sec-independent protein translocase protein TatA
MGGASIWHWIVVGLIVMLLFGRGKVSELMGDVAKGIKSFKKGMADDDEVAATEQKSEAPRSIEHQKSATVTTEESVAQKKVG